MRNTQDNNTTTAFTSKKRITATASAAAGIFLTVFWAIGITISAFTTTAKATLTYISRRCGFIHDPRATAARKPYILTPKVN